MNGKKLHVLLAEAHPDETACLLRALYPDGQGGLELTNVSSVSTLIATLEIVNPEVIFLDLALAQSGDLRANFGSSAVERSLREAAGLIFLPLTHAFCGATNRGKTCSLVVSLLTNCKKQSRVRPQTCLAGQAC
jgi:hypothetical protein